MTARWKRIVASLCEEKRTDILEQVFALQENVRVMGSYPLLKFLDQTSIDTNLVLQAKADCFARVVKTVLNVLPASRAVYQTIASPLSCTIDCYLYDELVFRVFIVEVFACHCSPVILLDKQVVFYANKGLSAKGTLIHKGYPEIALPLATLNNSGTLERKEARLSFLALGQFSRELPSIKLDGNVLQKNAYEKQNIPSDPSKRGVAGVINPSKREINKKFIQQFLQGKIEVQKTITLQLQACRGSSQLSCDIGSFIFMETAKAKLEQIYTTIPYSTKVPLVPAKEVEANPQLTNYYCLRVAEKRPSYRCFETFQDFLKQVS